MSETLANLALPAPDLLTGCPRQPAKRRRRGSQSSGMLLDVPSLEAAAVVEAWGTAARPVGAGTMTEHKHLKRRIRERMRRTGERYMTARRHTLARLSTRDAASGMPHPTDRDPARRPVLGPEVSPVQISPVEVSPVQIGPVEAVNGHAYVTVVGSTVTVYARERLLDSLLAALDQSGLHQSGVAVAVEAVGGPSRLRTARAIHLPDGVMTWLFLVDTSWSAAREQPPLRLTPSGLVVPDGGPERRLIVPWAQSNPCGDHWMRLVVQWSS